jgi:hypothetical protein
MIEMLGSILILLTLAAVIAHSFFIGTLYIEMIYSNGRPRYYVWRRAFLGFNNLMGSCDTELEAKELMAAVKDNPPRILNS